MNPLYTVVVHASSGAYSVFGPFTREADAQAYSRQFTLTNNRMLRTVEVKELLTVHKWTNTKESL